VACYGHRTELRVCLVGKIRLSWHVFPASAAWAGNGKLPPGRGRQERRGGSPRLLEPAAAREVSWGLQKSRSCLGGRSERQPEGRHRLRGGGCAKLLFTSLNARKRFCPWLQSNVESLSRCLMLFWLPFWLFPPQTAGFAVTVLPAARQVPGASPATRLAVLPPRIAGTRSD